MKIIVGTKNQTKIDIVLSVFKNVLNLSDVEVVAHDAESGVCELQ